MTDAHHNRVLWVDRYGAIKEVATFGNVVPTGLETTAGQFFVALLGPIPHLPEDGKIVAVRTGGEPTRGGQRGDHAHRRRAGAARHALRTLTGSVGRRR